MIELSYVNKGHTTEVDQPLGIVILAKVKSVELLWQGRQRN